MFYFNWTGKLSQYIWKTFWIDVRKQTCQFNSAYDIHVHIICKMWSFSHWPKDKKKKRHLDSFCRRCISGFNFQLITKKENMQTPGIFPQHSKVFKHHNMEKKKLKTKIRTSSQNEQLHVAVILKLASSSMNNPVCINPIQKTWTVNHKKPNKWTGAVS